MYVVSGSWCMTLKQSLTDLFFFFLPSYSICASSHHIYSVFKDSSYGAALMYRLGLICTNRKKPKNRFCREC